MLPVELTAEQFSNYPPEAKAIAQRELKLLQQMPLAFVPLLLRELITYDWKFPAERQDIEDQFRYLNGLSSGQLPAVLSAFAKLQLAPELERFDWVNSPAQFSEKLSALLWATHQMDQFRQASITYVHLWNESKQAGAQLPVPRFTMIVVGRDATNIREPLFRKLKPHGVSYTNLQPGEGLPDLLNILDSRAKQHPMPFAHWYIEGGQCERVAEAVSCVSYRELEPVRNALIRKMSATMRPGGGGPERLRTELASLQPADLGLESAGKGGVLSRFRLSLLTEGAGSQIFSTTFVQWTSREVLRRAQPLTLMARFFPRQREPMVQTPDTPSGAASVLDPNASLVDAEQGAYYTWINQQRLPGAEQASFLVWFEGRSQAFAASPKLKQRPGSISADKIRLGELAGMCIG